MGSTSDGEKRSRPKEGVERAVDGRRRNGDGADEHEPLVCGGPSSQSDRTPYAQRKRDEGHHVG